MKGLIELVLSEFKNDKNNSNPANPINLFNEVQTFYFPGYLLKKSAINVYVLFKVYFCYF